MNNEGILSFFFTLIGIIIIIILYTRLFIGIDIDNWNIQKCNPKYILYSGYIKENPNSNKYQTTTDNFQECIIRFNNKKDNRFSKILEKNSLEHLLKVNNIVNTRNKITAKQALELRKKVERENNKFKLQLEKIETMRETGQLQKEIDKLNDIIFDIQEYALSYLTYAMSRFVFKYKLAEEDDTLGNYLNNDASCNIYHGSGNEETCNSNIYCKYDTTDLSCNNITKGEFYEQEAINLNNTIKKHFGNNKL
tara:strand:- start:13 stop:765 length:753 start_codon:yes stop_codon:yes gene_type:complete